MLRYWSIGIFWILLLQNSNAQDSLNVPNGALVERLDQTSMPMVPFYSQPALRPFLYKYSTTPVEISYRNVDSERYLPQVGSGDQGVFFATDSYLKNTLDGYTLWGEAGYHNFKTKKQRFNESTDLDLIFPYVTADSVGGDMNNEQYIFSGGIAKQTGDWVLAVEGGYQANLAHRKIDPRPENTSSDIKLKASVSYRILNDYQLSFDVGAQNYKQRNTLRFVSGIGRPVVTYLNGMGAYNSLLSGVYSATDAVFYQINGLDATLSFAPRDHRGFFAQLGLNQMAGYRVLLGSRSHSNDWTNQFLLGRLGYAAHLGDYRFGAFSSIKLQTRKGREGLFSNTGSTNGFVKISELSSYRYFRNLYQLDAYFAGTSWSVKPFLRYSQMKEQYVSPFREQAIVALDIGLSAQYFWELNSGLLSLQAGLSKRNVVAGHSKFNGVREDSGVMDLLASSYNFLSAEPFTVHSRLRYDFVIDPQIKPYISFNTSHASVIKQQLYNFTVGFVF